jgi:hypothetical protein
MAGSFNPRYLKRFTAHDGPDFLTFSAIFAPGKFSVLHSGLEFSSIHFSRS